MLTQGCTSEAWSLRRIKPTKQQGDLLKLRPMTLFQYFWRSLSKKTLILIKPTLKVSSDKYEMVYWKISFNTGCCSTPFSHYRNSASCQLSKNQMHLGKCIDLQYHITWPGHCQPDEFESTWLTNCFFNRQQFSKFSSKMSTTLCNDQAGLQWAFGFSSHLDSLSFPIKCKIIKYADDLIAVCPFKTPTVLQSLTGPSQLLPLMPSNSSLNADKCNQYLFSPIWSLHIH